MLIRAFGYILVLLMSFLAACGDGQPPRLESRGELRVLTRFSSTTAKDEDSGPQGFERELVRQFASDHNLRLRFIPVASEAEIYERLQRGDAHFAAAWLSPPADSDVGKDAGKGSKGAKTRKGKDEAPASNANNAPELSELPPIQAVVPHSRSGDVIVQHEAALPVDRLAALAGREVHLVAAARHVSAVDALNKLKPAVKLVEHPDWSEGDLVAAVAAGKVELALTDALAARVAETYSPELVVVMDIGKPRPIAWLFPRGSDPGLLEKVNDFFSVASFDGTLARLKDRFFGQVQRLRRNDAVQFLEKVRTVLPDYEATFKQAQLRSGIDWRMLAALAYQESQWDPLATSPTGVRGMMMLTEDTADRLGVANRLEPKQSIRAGALYLADLQDQLPPTIGQPDRLWFALAAYNLGLGHLNGARQIAESMKVDVDSWYEMKKVLPLMARPEYYNRLKSGRARGGEAVIMVENIRVFYDILSRTLPAYEPPADKVRKPRPEKKAKTDPAKKLKPPSEQGGSLGLKPGGGLGLKPPPNK